MANETHTLRIGIDASLAKRGSQAYVAAVGRMAQASRDFEKLQTQLGKSAAKSGSFNAIARDLAKLNSIRLNPSLGKNLNQLSSALAGFKSPSNTSVKNMRNFLRTLSTTRVNSSIGKNIGSLTAAVSQFKGPSRPAVANTQNLLRVLSSARLTGNFASQMTNLSAALRSMQGPNTQMVRNVEALARAISQIRVPRGLGSLSSAMTGLNTRFGSGSSAAIRFGGSVNGIPWGRASAGAIQLTGNLRGLENAMSLSYQMGSQLRALFGALTVSGFTAGVIEATVTSDRLRNVLMAVSDSQEEVNAQMEYAETAARKYGLNYLEVERNLGRFTAATRTAGLTAEQSNFIFESLGRQSRLFGLDVQQQARAMLAITQGFQKGTIRAEEFRSQLGEQIPVWQFMVEAIAELKNVDASQIDLNKMMELGQVGPDAYVLMFQKMEEALGEGIANAMRHPLVQMENLRTSWTKFLELVGKSGVMDALGQAAQRISSIMDSEQFQSMASGVAEGLSSAILKVGDAAAYLLENIESVGKVIATLLGMKAVATIGQMGLAFGQLGAMITGVVTNIGAFAMRLSGLGRFAGVLGALPIAVAAIGTAFATTAIAAGAGLALMWDKTVKFGDTTTTVGAMARVVFSDIGKFASDAAAKIGEMFQTLAAESSTIGATIASMVYPVLNGVVDFLGVVGSAIGPIVTQFMGLGGQLIQTVGQVGTVLGNMFNAMTGDLDTSQMTWLDWSKAIVGFVALVGETMIRVFRTAWRLVVQNTLDAFAIIQKTITGIGSAFNMVGALANFDGAAAKRFADEAAAAFDEAGEIGRNAFKESFGSLQELFGGTNESVDRYVNSLQWGDMGSTAGQDFVEGMTGEATSRLTAWGQSIADRSLLPEFNPTRPEFEAPDTSAPQIDTAGLNPLLGQEADALGEVGKRAKDAKDAIEEFTAEQANLKAMLDAGRISLDQYNSALDFHKGKLEETVDPYSAMIRSMQEENNILRLNGQEQRLASEYMNRRNELLEKGVVLTDEQTEALKRMIAEQDKLKNPSPLQSWIDGMETFGDAIESAGVRAMEGLSDSLADLIVDGKADWASLAKTILKDLVKIGLNEMWKGLFGGAQVQQVVNAPMTGAVGQQTMLGLNTPAGNSSIMASAVAQGIQMAGGGMGALVGNDVGNGPGSFGDFQQMFGKQTTSNTTALGPAALGAPGIGNAPTFNDWAPAGAAGGGSTGGAVGLMESMLGMHETRNNQSINSFLKKGGIDINAAQTAWCAGFVNSSLEQIGVKGNGSLVATDFMTWGQAVRPEDVMRGDVMVEHRGLTPGSTGGHVGMATGQTRMGEFGQEYQMISGNASNQVQHDWYRADQIAFRRATPDMMTGGLPGGLSQAGMTPQQPGVYSPMAPAGGYGMGMSPGMGSMMTPTGAAGGLGGLPGGLGIPSPSIGAGAAASGMPGASGGMSGLGDSLQAELTPAFQQVATQVPQQFDPAMGQVAQQLPQKLTEGEGLGQGLESAMQPANQMSAQNFQQAYMQANQQVAQNFAQVMSAQMSGMSAGGGGGGIGAGMNMIGPLMGAFFKSGGVVGQGGGSTKAVSGVSWSGARSMKIGGIVGDPDAEPIIAHRGELVTPAHQVDAMRRMGKDAVLLDNAAVDSSRRKMGSGHHNDESTDGVGSTSSRFAPARPIVNYNITTPNADSFRASQSQIQAKAGAAAYRDAVRNH